MNEVDAIFEGSSPSSYVTLVTTYPLISSVPYPAGSEEFKVLEDAKAYVAVEITAKVNASTNNLDLKEEKGVIFVS